MPSEPLRNAAPENARSGAEPDYIVLDELAWDAISGRDDPAQRFRLVRLCPCGACAGSGKTREYWTTGLPFRCPECRGEGRALELVATAGTPEAVGTALVTLGREGEFEECPIGLLDLGGEPSQRWLIRPWGPSPRNTSDAGKLLRSVQPAAATKENP